MQTSIHIIGAGLAGWNLAQEVRKLSQEIQITIVCADSGDFYNKILLSTMFEKNAEPDDLITQTGVQKAKELNVHLIANTKVASINSQEQKLVLENGSLVDYQNLVIATGAYPIKLPFLASNSKVFFVNDLQDYRFFKKQLKPNTKVAILGAGLVGVEFAHDLLNSDAQISLISDTPNILANLAPQQVSQPLLKVLQNAGLQTVLGTALQGIEDLAQGLKLNFANGDSLQVDILLSAIGLRAETNLANSGGCELEKNGIKVNSKLETSQKNIYALGDCACINGKNLMFVEPLQQGAKLLAKNLLMKQEVGQEIEQEPAELKLPALPVILKTSRYPLTSVMPDANAQGQWQIEEKDTGVSAKFLDKDDKILGFALSGTEVRYTNRLAKQLPNLI